MCSVETSLRITWHSGVQAMECKSCHSAALSEHTAEINIHPPALLKNLSKPTIWTFPLLLICLNCGFSQFVLTESERLELLYNKAKHWQSVGHS